MDAQRTTIVLDCDGVLADLCNPFEKFIESYYQRPLVYKNSTAYLLRDSLGISEAEERNLVTGFYHSRFFETIQPYEGARKMVRHLSYHFNLAVATARPSWLREKTHCWHYRCFSPVPLPVYHTGEYEPENADFLSKEELCRHLNAPLIVEDRPSNVLSCAEQGIRVILISHNYNQEVQHDLITRVSSLPDVPCKVKQILCMHNP